jgi:hypothetical protein
MANRDAGGHSRSRQRGIAANGISMHRARAVLQPGSDPTAFRRNALLHKWSGNSAAEYARRQDRGDIWSVKRRPEVVEHPLDSIELEEQ